MILPSRASDAPGALRLVAIWRLEVLLKDDMG